MSNFFFTFFYTCMNINALNTISYNKYKNNDKIQRLSFNGIPPSNVKNSITIEEMLPSKETKNSKILLDLVKQNKYKEANRFLEIIKNNFNPVYQPKNEQPLLLQVAAKNDKLSLQQKEYQDLIVRAIISHENFDINKKFNMRDRSGYIYEASYIEEAVNSNNLSLLLNAADIYNCRIDDPNGGFFTKLMDIAFQKKHFDVTHFLKILSNASFSARNEDCKSEIVDNAQSTQDSDDDENKTSVLLSGTKAFIPESVPSSLDGVAGISKAKKLIEKFIINPWKNKDSEFFKQNKVRLPNGFLMYGPKGTGKTYITSVIAKQTGYPMYNVNISTIGSKYVAQTANNLRTIFNELEKNYKKTGIPSIVFFDEFDDIAGSRKDSDSSCKREDAAALLREFNNIAERGIILIAATNYIDTIDDAIIRSGRFDVKLEITLPDKDERKSILTKMLQDRPAAVELLKNVDYLADITDGKSPADLDTCVNNCIITAASENKIISVSDFNKEMELIEESKRKNPIGFRV